MAQEHSLQLKGFSFDELLHPTGLERLDQCFLAFLKQKNPEVEGQLLAYRAGEFEDKPIEISELLITCGFIFEEFLGELFGIEEALAIAQIKTTTFNPISIFKKYYVLKRARKELSKVAGLPPFEELNTWLVEELKKAPLKADDKELTTALFGNALLEKPEQYQAEIEKLVAWCTRALSDPEGRKIVAGWSSFDIPERIDYNNLVPTVALANDKFGRLEAGPDHLRFRDGFKLTDPRMNARQVQDEVNYCIYCHDHDGDFCSKGFPVKKGDPALGFKKNPQDVILTGCPLEEKISEMNYLKKEGATLASLAMVMVDNPMCPATGHRICNDCMKACIYQKQDPVNIPQIETRVLLDVLDLPWGVEIYDLLTRWNPLRQTQWVTKPYNGLKVMIAGMGPAGFTLAHHLLLEGFAVVGFDGLKIEPLPKQIISSPIYRFQDLKESLDERFMAGFGGVAEYGITVRWDKNFLKLIYLSLMRRPHFQVFGGVRFGGTITVNDAWEMGFDHFVIAVGAGLPKALPIPGSLATGMRQANDFLMALQLGNAAKSSSLTNLQVRLPAVVIGGGLTGVDTATEIQAYYIRQVEKILMRYEILVKAYGREHVLEQLDPASAEILNEYLTHGQAVREERERAKAEKRQPNFIKLIRHWGGVTIAYRRSMQESPAYLNNHEELQKALEEGIYYAEGLEPTAVDLNEYGHVEALLCHRRVKEGTEWKTSTETVRLPARAILVATGTSPNTAYEFEHRGTFNRLNLQYQHYEEEDGEFKVAHGARHCKDPHFGPFTSYRKDHLRVSLVGDTHPVFHGSVVKAIASGMRTYPKILDILKDKIKKGDEAEYQSFAKRMTDLFQTSITRIERKTPTVLEISILAPLAAKHFQAGQFYRLQNFETLAPSLDHTLLQMEPLALITAACNAQTGELTFTVKQDTATTKLCSLLKPGELISLMGPTGVRAKMPAEQETILIMGDASSFAFLRSYGASLRRANNRVIYICVLEHASDLYCQAELETYADVIIYLTKEGGPVKIKRSCDHADTGDDAIHVLLQYANEQLPIQDFISLSDIDRVYIVGNTDLLRRFQAARSQVLKPFLLKDPKVFGSVYGNMQCMLKGVCAQCLQWQINPETGERTKAVFACSWQDQPLEIIDIDHVDARQLQNRLHEEISNLWVDHLFKTNDLSLI